MATRRPGVPSAQPRAARHQRPADRGADAVRREVETLVEAVDRRFEKARDDKDDASRAHGALGGPGNFGGGALDDAAGENGK